MNQAIWLVLLGAALLIIVLAVYCYWNRRVTDTTVVNSRRQFFQAAAIAIPTVTIGGATVQAFRGSRDLEVVHQTLSYPALPQYLRDYKVVQITDVHVGNVIDLTEFHRIMDMALAQEADRLVITGDLIDKVDWVGEVAARLQADFGKYPDGIDYVLGNHEYYRNLRLVLERLSKVVRVHCNSHLKISGGSWPVYLVGVEYPFKGTAAQRNAYLDDAMAGVPQGAFVILLAHHPGFITEAFERSIPLTLSGHTHGGQINLFGESLVPVARPYWKGLYQEKNSYGYVSRGTGQWWPMRWQCPREMTVFTFQETQS